MIAAVGVVDAVFVHGAHRRGPAVSAGPGGGRRRSEGGRDGDKMTTMTAPSGD